MSGGNLILGSLLRTVLRTISSVIICSCLCYPLIAQTQRLASVRNVVSGFWHTLSEYNLAHTHGYADRHGAAIRTNLCFFRAPTPPLSTCVVSIMSCTDEGPSCDAILPVMFPLSVLLVQNGHVSRYWREWFKDPKGLPDFLETSLTQLCYIRHTPRIQKGWVTKDLGFRV